MLVSVVVPTHSRLGILRQTVGRLLGQELTDGDYELIVVDDHSEDGTYEWLCEEARREPRLQTVRSPRRGRSAARNAGIAAAGGELLVFLDDDMWVGPGFLEAHGGAYREAAGAPVVSVGKMRPWPDNAPTIANLAYDRRLAHIDDCMTQYGDDLPCRYLCTGNVSIPRSLLGPGPAFDEGFAGYSFEDTELGYSLAEKGAGFRYVPEAYAEHRTDTTMAALLRKREEAGRSAVRFLQRHPEAAEHMEVPYEVSGVASTARQDGLGKRLGKSVLFSRVGVALGGVMLTIAAAAGIQETAVDLIQRVGYVRYGRAYREAAATCRHASD